MTLLSAAGVQAGYGPVQVLHGLDFSVEQREVVVILGANGAGKTTTLRAVCGMIPAKGEITLEGRSIAGRRPEEIVRAGVAHVPQGRGTFPDLTVFENLRLGAFIRSSRSEINEDIEFWYELFPRLQERHEQKAGSLSGGEQQMLAIARAMMSRPRLLLLDEPSLGLAPIVTQQLFEQLARLNRETGLSMLIVEQNATLALAIASRAYVLEAGAIALSGEASQLREDDSVRRAYLGY